MKKIFAAIAGVLFLVSAPAFAEMPKQCHKDGKKCQCHSSMKHGKGHTGMKMSSAGLKGSSKEYMDAMIAMHKGMNITYTGETDTDFVRGMIPHHQGAVDMANTLLKFGKDEELRTLATRIIIAQKQEIAFMKSWLDRKSSLATMGTDAIAAKASVKAFEKANATMHTGMMIDYSGDADVDFARGMIPHHQGAVDMADVLLTHGGRDASLQKLARDIKLSQNREILQMKRWLAKHDIATPVKTKPSKKGKKKHH